MTHKKINEKIQEIFKWHLNDENIKNLKIILKNMNEFKSCVFIINSCVYIHDTNLNLPYTHHSVDSKNCLKKKT